MKAINNKLIRLSILKLGSMAGILSGVAANGFLDIRPTTQSRQNAVIDSLSSVLKALLQVAEQLNLDPVTCIRAKLSVNIRKYPTNRCKVSENWLLSESYGRNPSDCVC